VIRFGFVPSAPWPPPDALLARAIVGLLTNYGVFAALIVAAIWLWLTNVSVLLGGAFAAWWSRTV
jgi:uncharacterized BrkB/YihY/UPF0761 family membrane protein